VSGLVDVKVERGATAKLGRVEGDLRVERAARITAAEGDSVTVTGGAYFEGDASVDSSFQCDSLFVERASLRVNGDLTVLRGADVAHTVRVSGSIRAGDIGVGGRMYAGSVACERAVRVGGVVEVDKTLEASSLDVGGKVAIRGAVKLKDLRVGGMAEVGGGSISGRATIGGVFSSGAPLEFGEMQVYGRCTLPAGCKGRRISTWGKLSVNGDLGCEQIDVGGMTEVRGNCTAGKVTVNGKLAVRGSLSFKDTLENFGDGEVGGEVDGTNLRVGGRFRAYKILLSDRAEVAGEVETDVGMKAKTVHLSSGSRCRGPIVGDRVELSKSEFVAANWAAGWAGQIASLRLVGRMTHVEDVFGDQVVIGANTRCGRVFARTIELGAGCILDQATYTGDLRQGRQNVHFTQPPEKVEKLPPFPL
jgi:cytoskeletal protein CcmA (bactofilin family)